MIYDIFLIAIFITLIIINVHRGAMRALAGIVTAFIAYMAATYLGKLLAAQVYDALFRPAIEKAVADSVSSIGTNAAATISDTLPSWLSGVLGISGADVSKLLSQPISGMTDTAASTVNAAVQPVAVNLITVILTVVLFMIIAFLLRWLIVRHIAGLFNEIPVVRVVNRIVGGVIGFIDAALLVSMLAYLLKLLMPNISSGAGIFNESTIYNSFIFYHFYSGNIFTAVFSRMGI